ncbi:MAG: M23 family metallopeptidase [Lachnospiraceae bacterium]|nr:M23 family metallopeptidase [Lachnospiraceae bacterium]
MEHIGKKELFLWIEWSLAALFVSTLFLNSSFLFHRVGENFFHVFLNEVQIGTVGEREAADELLIQARRQIAEASENIVFMEADLRVEGEEVLFGELDEEDLILARMQEVLRDNIHQTMHEAYTLKVNEYMVNLGSIAQVQELLQAAVDKYDTEHLFEVELLRTPDRELSVLTARVTERAGRQATDGTGSVSAGVDEVLQHVDESSWEQGEKDFDDFALGLKNMNFAEEVEIGEVYLPQDQISSLEEAIEDVIKEQETVGEYTVVSGDTLSEISIKVNIPMDKIVSLNSDKLDDENSMIHVGDKLVITVPEPELSVERLEQNYYEEIYDADIIYIENDDWYTNQSVVHQQPSAGFRRIVADVSYLNDKEVSREILKEDVLMEAVPKIVERGTKIPPTYIKPISGGRLSSGFGKRTAPTKGASTYHKGVDWAVPTGTSVYASCGGTVAKAGWGSGYGYVVYIDHEDGRQTRYGHLSKVLVKAGQTVKQGERIALSGSTGVSTGPHLHFEILIGGSQVNPLKYLN